MRLGESWDRSLDGSEIAAHPDQCAEMMKTQGFEHVRAQTLGIIDG